MGTTKQKMSSACYKHECFPASRWSLNSFVLLLTNAAKQLQIPPGAGQRLSERDRYTSVTFAACWFVFLCCSLLLLIFHSQLKSARPLWCETSYTSSRGSTANSLRWALQRTATKSIPRWIHCCCIPTMCLCFFSGLKRDIISFFLAHFTLKSASFYSLDFDDGSPAWCCSFGTV